VMVVHWNELPQVAAFDFAFVEHGYPCWSVVVKP
jgi:hypothetical protein